MDISVHALLCLAIVGSIISLPTGPPELACEGRTPGHYPHEPLTENCGYALYSNKWQPGAAVRMAIFHDDINVAFRGFLASIYYDDKPVGQMSLDKVRTEPRRKTLQTMCNGTSVSHTENGDKEFVSFHWLAPTDLPLEAELIVRLTVVANYSSFYVDCQPYALVPENGNTTVSTTSTSTTTPSTTTETTIPAATTSETTTPETTTKATTTQKPTTTSTETTTKDPTTTTEATTASTKITITEATTTIDTTTTQETTTETKTTKRKQTGRGINYTGQHYLKHEVISDISCQEGNNVFTLVKETNCKEFVHHFRGRLSTGVTRQCLGWAKFSPKLCSCAYVEDCQFP